MGNSQERWNSIGSGYEISDFGRVRGPSGKILSPYPNAKGYLRFTYWQGGKKVAKRVHREVAAAFVPNPLGLPFVNHINFDKSDNRAVNLEWCTHDENVRHAVSNGRVGAVRLRKLSPEQVLAAVERSRDGEATSSIAASIGVDERTLRQLFAGKTYRGMGFVDRAQLTHRIPQAIGGRDAA